MRRQIARLAGDLRGDIQSNADEENGELVASRYPPRSY
jgi:hypothetical protein